VVTVAAVNRTQDAQPAARDDGGVESVQGRGLMMYEANKTQQWHLVEFMFQFKLIVEMTAV